MTTYRRLSSFRTVEEFQAHLMAEGISLPVEAVLEAGPAAPLAQPLTIFGQQVGNRFAVLPMEGWDGTPEGRPTELTFRRWRRFGASGAKLIWGGEAVAVRPDGRANPRQLLLSEANVSALAALREALVEEHQKHFGRTDDLLVGLQLTHSGRFSCPHVFGRPEPVLVYHHPLLDRRLGLPPDYPVLSDAAVAELVEAFIKAACRAQQAGFAFVDLKHCHGYLGHEFLSAVDRPGRYGGSFENRTRFLREVVAGIRQAAPGLGLAVRVSIADWLPFRAGPAGIGQAETPPAEWYPYAFGGDGTGRGIDWTEPRRLLDLLWALDIPLVGVTLGSPYYNPHLQRPAWYPPCDGYLPPEDPLRGVARHLAVTAEVKRWRPELIVVGAGYSYLQEWLPHVAQAAVRQGWTDFVGLGRMMLAYPELPADVLAGRPLRRRQLCRTFSDCTTAPRNGLPSGCYPLDPYYHHRPEAVELTRYRLRRFPGAAS